MGFLLAIIAAIFFPGIILRVKSTASGRKGPGILQPWKNIRVLLRKGSVISTTTSYISRIAPVIYLSTILCALLLLPFPGVPPIIAFEGDFVLFAYMLALGKFLFMLGAIDSGNSFGGMGANRKSLFSMLAEPAFFILFGSMALLTGYTSMQQIVESIQLVGYNSFIIGALAAYVLIQIAIVETSRLPVDDPNTRNATTMVDGVMILDFSGFDLALIQIGTLLRLAMYGVLVANFLIPAGWPVLTRIALFIGVQIAFASMIGLIESFRARKKLSKNPQFIISLNVLALVAFVLVLLINFKMIGK
ncbi:MAG: NADH-quinone oxidoreductase subunit H [Bacteroidetes bacterium]|nr:NADH-quinone oxidoreductase subunit H [Bacteroidota bacterium]